MSERINALEKQRAQILEKQKKYAEECQRKIKAINEQIALEKKKDAARCEKLVVDMVRDIYGEINDDTIRRFEKFVRENSISVSNKAGGDNGE